MVIATRCPPRRLQRSVEGGESLMKDLEVCLPIVLSHSAVPLPVAVLR